jgi:outer membrane protein insertion porin family
LRLADDSQQYRLGFTEPYFLDTKWTLGGAYERIRDSSVGANITQDRESIITRVGYPIFEYTRLFLTHDLTDLTIRETENPTIDRKLENGISSSLALSMVHDKRNNIFETSAGYYLSGKVEFTGVGGAKKFWKAQLEGRYFKQILGDLVLRTRVKASQIYTVADNPVPRLSRFGLGGPRNLRGYNSNNVGPQLWARKTGVTTGPEESWALGGNQSVFGQLEFEHPLIKEAGLKWVVFYDVGNVFEDRWGADSDTDLLQDYGFGFRWFSPIGVLRFELGYPINPRSVDASNQFYFDIGQIF